MKKSQSVAVEVLAKQSMKEIDEVLLLLWENGIEDVTGPKDMLVGGKLQHAKHILGIPGASQLTSLTYWGRVFDISETALRQLLSDWGFSMSLKARKLPTGAVRKLKAEANRKNVVLQVVPEVPISSDDIVSNERVNWTTVGVEEDDINSIDVDDILRIHFTLVEDFRSNNDPINPSGPRDINLLRSALFRQETSISGEAKYKSVAMRAAALLHSLIHNHPFHNGNKRTALVSLLVFLDNNQTMLTCSQDDLFKFVLTVAQHRIIKGKFEDLADREVLAIAEWLVAHSRSVKLGDRTLPFRKCRQLLINKYGCEITHSLNGRNFKISRKIRGQGLFDRSQVLISHISLRNEGDDIQVRTIKKIRQDLRLDEEHGIDSAAFYDNVPTAVDEFIIRYRKTLLRLAKL